MRSRKLPYRWCGPGLLGLDDALKRWEGTPYRADQQSPGSGVDCVRFVCGVLDELFGLETDARTLPQDVALHQPRMARAAMKRIMSLYSPFETVSGLYLVGGDVLVVGERDGGPGHVMIVGSEPWTIWHATRPCVQKTGFSLPETQKVFKIYRRAP